MYIHIHTHFTEHTFTFMHTHTYTHTHRDTHIFTGWIKTGQTIGTKCIFPTVRLPSNQESPHLSLSVQSHWEAPESSHLASIFSFFFFFPWKFQTCPKIKRTANALIYPSSSYKTHQRIMILVSFRAPSTFTLPWKILKRTLERTLCYL